MSERINVDHAFDPEARQAQAELDGYMDSRPFQDAKGNVHHPENSQFIKYDDYSDKNREGHYEDSLKEGDYSNESLEDLARRVAAARAEGDKTRALDAEEAFFDKFTAYSEKYGWDKEDGSANGPHVDKDAKLGRSTIDDRLERYTKLMYGESETETAVPQPEQDTFDQTVDINPETAPDAAEQRNDSSSQESEVEVESESKAEVARSVDDMADDAMARLNARADEMASEAVDRMNGTDQAKEDREIIHGISSDGLSLEDSESESEIPGISDDGLELVDQPNEDPALENESLEEYEGRHRLPISSEELDRIETAGLEPVDEDEPADRTRTRRLRDRFSSTALAARTSAWRHTRRVKSQENTRDEERKGNKKAIIGLGVLTAAVAGVGIYLAHKYGSGHDGGIVDMIPKNTGDKANKAHGVAAKAQEVFGNGSVEVRNGDGYTQVLDRVLDSHNVHLNADELYKLHQHLEHVKGDYINLHGANDVYTMGNGDSGLTHADSGARISEDTQKMVVRWLEAHGKLS